MQALVLVDIQNDFMPFGALPVGEGDLVVDVANTLAQRFGLVIATQDWHPADHGSFASNHPGSKPGDVVQLGGINQVLWPDHCVQNTPGASFYSGLDVSNIGVVCRKGSDPEIDSYSGFFDNGHRQDTGLDRLLRDRDAESIVLVGLATDYCVKFTALDGRQLGYDVTVISDGVRGVELLAGDGGRALDEMRDAGCRVVTSAEL